MLVQLASIAIALAVAFVGGGLYPLIAYLCASLVLNIAVLARAGYWGTRFDAFEDAKVRDFSLDDDAPADLRGISIVDAKLACQSFFTPIFERYIMVFMGPLLGPTTSGEQKSIFVRHEGAHWKAHDLFNKTIEQQSFIFRCVQWFSLQVFKISAISRHFNAVILAVNEVGFHTFDVAQTKNLAKRISLLELRRLYLYHLLEELEHSYECVNVLRTMNPVARLAWTPICVVLLIAVNLAFEVFAVALLFQWNWRAGIRYLATLECVLHFLNFLNSITRALVIVHFVRFPSLGRLQQRHTEYTRMARDEFAIDLTGSAVLTLPG